MPPFFKIPDPAPEPDPEPRRVLPPWSAPPTGVVPGVVSLDLLLVVNEQVAVVLSRLGAYPEGFEFDLWSLTSPAIDPEKQALLEGPRSHRLRMPRGRIAPEDLRFGFEFADGAKATNLPGPHMTPRGSDDGPPDSPVLRQGAGGGSSASYRQSYWVWPLPPPGPLAFVCEWPAFDVPETRVEIDAQLVLDAAAQARRFFPDAPPGGSSYSSGYGGASTSTRPTVRQLPS